MKFLLTFLTLRLIFVCLTNILLITSLISLVSNSLTEVGQHFKIPVRWSPTCDQIRSVELMHTRWPSFAENIWLIMHNAPIGHGTCKRRVSLPVGGLFTLDAVPRLTNGNPIRYSIYVLESSTSRRLTYFMPPLVSLHLIVPRKVLLTC
jgi:hypothetical protein